jgi:hypothetical protein
MWPMINAHKTPIFLCQVSSFKVIYFLFHPQNITITISHLPTPIQILEILHEFIDIHLNLYKQVYNILPKIRMQTSQSFLLPLSFFSLCSSLFSLFIFLHSFVLLNFVLIVFKPSLPPYSI